MINTVEKFLEGYLNYNNTFYIGFSGGYDSLCLLDIMVKLSKRHKFKIFSLHLNHNFRGQEAFEEQEKCRDISNFYNVKFITETLNEQNNHSENFAREERYKFFEKYAKNKKNTYVLTAHNMNDNIETLIYRIVKGTGIKGLTGIPNIIDKNGVTYLRPLLNVSRKDIENYCSKLEFQPNHDSSNEDNIYKRNIIRNKVLPLLKEINTDAEKSIQSLCELAIQNENVIDSLLKDYFIDNTIYFDKYNCAIEPLKLKIIHKFLIDNKIEYDRKKISEITEFLNDKTNINKKYSVTKNLWIKYDINKIYFLSKKEKISDVIAIKNNGTYKLPFGGSFEITAFQNKMGNYPKENDLKAIVDLSNFTNLVLRTRRDGDIIQPFGMQGTMKLKKYLISKKIPQEKRDSLLLLASGQEILWVIGVGLSDKLKVAKTPTNMIKYNY